MSVEMVYAFAQFVQNAAAENAGGNAAQQGGNQQPNGWSG
jgi:hypothetical protein